MPQSAQILRNPIATFDRIILAAVECYQRFGVQGSSMDMIAQEANTSKPTLYAHFGSKDKLFDAVITAISENMINDENFSYRKGQSPHTQLVAIFSRQLQSSLEPDKVYLFRAIMVETARRDKGLPNYDKSKKEMLLRKWLQDAHEDDAISIEDLETTTNNLLAIINGRFFYPEILGIKHFSEKGRQKEIEKSITTFLKPLIKPNHIKLIS